MTTRRDRAAKFCDSHHLDKVIAARALRRASTPAERSLWTCLRRRALGVRWRRQHVLRGFILDFYAPRPGMVVELDGPIHDRQPVEDQRREAALMQLGLFIVRVRNQEIFEDMQGVLRRLRALVEPLLPSR